MTTSWRLDETQTRVASLPMYDFPELREAHDQLWGAFARALAAAGVARAPDHLQRGEEGDRAWGDPRLLLTQVCGYPLALGLRGHVRRVATPAYRARGCQGPYHRSVILVRAGDPAMALADTRGRRLALNAPDSNTGSNLLRAELAALGGDGPFFGAVLQTGAHAASVAALVEGVADVAAVDCVSWAQLERLAPERARRLRVLGWTRPSPGLPLVTGALTTDEELHHLIAALEELATAPELKEARRLLLLEGFHAVPERAYAALATIAQGAPALG